MTTSRRWFLRSSVGFGAMAWGAGPLWAAAQGSGEDPERRFHLRTVSTTPVRIAAIEILRVKGKELIRVTSTDGAVGLVMANDRMKVLASLFKEMVAPYFVGKDAREVEGLVEGVYLANYKYSGMPFWNCVAHVELGVLDLLGQIARKPLGQLLGKVIRTEIPIYVSSMRRDTTPEQEVEWVGRRVAETGAGAVKLKIGGRMSRDADAAPGRTERLVALARKSFGDKMVIYVDANGSYGVAKGIEVGKMLQEHKIDWYEEPCPWEEHEQTKRVADALEMTVAGGEQDTSLARWRWMIENRGVDLVQPDLFYNGGILRASRVAALAAAAGMQITPHHPKVGAELAPMVQFASFTANLGPYQEFNGAPYKAESWYGPGFEVRHGAVAVPAGPGLGVEYDAGVMKEAQAV